MALQSSGQISLSQIAAEFGGSAPHALSEYYGKGNAPASGEIQLAADFYGTSNIFTTTLSYATHVYKVGNEALGFSNSSSTYAGTTIDGGTHPSSLGSLAAQPSGPNINHLFRTSTAVTSDALELEFASTFTAWTSITIGSKTFTRASAATPGSRSGGTTNRRYQWRNASNNVSTYITADNGANNVELDPFGTGGASGTPSGTVTITLNF
jgi:hypothetical protein